MLSTDIITIPTPPLFSFEECLWFLDRSYDDCMHRVKDGEVIKALEINGRPLLISITGDAQNIYVHLLKGKATLVNQQAITEYITEWFDLQRDIQPFYNLLKKDNTLSYMGVAFEGLRLLSINDLFEALSWSIIGQQINLTFAYKLKRRIVEKYGKHIDYKGEQYHLFPTPEALSNAAVEDLRAMQFSQKKAEYLIGVAKAFKNGEISKELIAALPTLEAQQQALTNLRGIGVWTANYALMKSLRITTSIPHGDVGLLKALTEHGIIKERKDTEAINVFFARYEGWQGYLIFYLWRSLATKK